MILNFTNLAFYTPDTLTLTLKGTGTVTKALADVTISGNQLTYTPTTAEKTTLGTGTVYVQVKFTAGTEYLKSEVVKLSANDLDAEIMAEITITEDFAAEIAELKTLVGGKVSKAGDTMTGILFSNRGTDDSTAYDIFHNGARGATRTTTLAKYIRFRGKEGSENSGTTGMIIDVINSANESRLEMRSYTDGDATTGYSMIQVVQPKNGIGVPRFYRSADSSLGVSAAGPYDMLHAGNYSSFAVPKTGGTFTGDVMHTSNVFIDNDNVTKGTNPSATQYRGVYFRDVANARLHMLETSTTASGLNQAALCSYRFNTSGGSEFDSIGVIKNADGTGYPYFRHTPAGGSAANYVMMHQNYMKFVVTSVARKATTTNYEYTGLSVSGGTYGADVFYRIGWSTGQPNGYIISTSSTSTANGVIVYRYENSTYFGQQTPMFHVPPGYTYYFWERRASVPTGNNTTWMYVRSYNRASV